MKLIVLFALILNSTFVFAGGGGCDGPCPYTPTDLLLTCTVVSTKLENLPEGVHDTFKIAQKVQGTIAESHTFYLGGDRETGKVNSISPYLDHEGKVASYFRQWSENDPRITLTPVMIPGSRLHQHISYSGVGKKDFPVIDRAFFEIKKAGADELATFKLTVNLSTDFGIGSSVTALSGEARCQ